MIHFVRSDLRDFFRIGFNRLYPIYFDNELRLYVGLFSLGIIIFYFH